MRDLKAVLKLTTSTEIITPFVMFFIMLMVKHQEIGLPYQWTRYLIAHEMRNKEIRIFFLAHNVGKSIEIKEQPMMN